MFSPARAAPHAAQRVPAQVAAAVTETAKVTLPETSPSGPALWTARGVPSSTTFNSALAWTGTDAAHHVNVLTSADGQHFGSKMTLNETAISSPAVAAILSGPSATRVLVVAWTGTDARHSLNIIFDVFDVTGHRSKRTLVDTSIAGPALVRNQFLAGENLQLAWTGTDVNHSLNVLQLDEVGLHVGNGDITGLTLGPKTTLPARLNSFDGPGLTSEIFQDQTTLLITWAQASGSLLSLVDVSPGVTNGAVFFSSQTTVVRPGLLALASPAGLHFWWSWTGTDPRHSLNLMDTGNFTQWPGPVTTFVETATGGPALGSVAGASQLLLAWTGTDAAQHLNIATLAV